MLLQRNRPRRRKLFLPPGYIALSLFVCVASLCVLKHKRMEPVRVIEISYPTPYLWKQTEAAYMASKNNWHIQLANDALLFDTQRPRIDSIMAASRQNADTNLLIEMAFDDSLPYQHFISIIDLLRKNNQRRFWIADSTITALFYVDPSPEKAVKEKKGLPEAELITCGLQFIPPTQFELMEIERKKRMIQAKADRERQAEVFPFFGAHFLLLLVFGLISFGKLRKLNT